MEVEVETAVPGPIADVVTRPIPTERRILVVDDVSANRVALAASVAPLNRLPRATASRSLRVVLIDDNLDAVELLAELLVSRGHKVMTAHDGHQGLALIREHRPEVALIDLGLPGIDGLTVARELRSGTPDIKTRLIALTGFGNASDRQRTNEAGFHTHLTKPASMASILECLAAVPT